MKYTSAIFRQIPALALSVGAVLAVAGCTRESALPPCPNIFALSDARQMDHFRPGSGRTVADIDYSVRLDSWKGSCGYKPRGADWDVNVDLELAFTVLRGPANTTGVAEFDYFAAIPYFFPKDTAKQSFPVKVEFSADKTEAHVKDGPLSLTIPVHADDAIDTYTIYLGLQLQPDELRHNRQGK